MIKYFQKAFKITGENIILTTPLILFLFLLSIYLEVAKNAPANLFSMLLLLVTTLFMLAAFSAGWFYMVKKAVDIDKQEFLVPEERAKASFGLLKEFSAGIGEYFLSFIGGIMLYFVLFMVLSLISYKLGIHFLGKIDLSATELQTVLNASDVRSALAIFPTNRLAKLEIWYLIFLVVMTIHYFLTLFLAPAIVNGVKNPIAAFVKSLKFLFKNFVGALILFLYVNVVSFVASLLISGLTLLRFIPNFITALASMLIYFYFIVYVIVLVFLYYDSQSTKTTESYCSSGSDSVGQDGVCGQDSLEQ